MKVLVENGADVNLSTYNLPLLEAVYRNKVNMVKLLVQSGATYEKPWVSGVNN
jgi:ankyrin repeat protein